MNYILKIHKNKRLTIPKAVMEKYDMKTGDYIKLIVLNEVIQIIPMKMVPKNEYIASDTHENN